MSNKAEIAGSNPEPNVWSRGLNRFAQILFYQNHKSAREVADYFLFVIGVTVETALLFMVLADSGNGAVDPQVRSLVSILFVPLVMALALHQFLIFRNATLHDTNATRDLRRHEIAICTLFGVLTGEFGYFYVLARCNDMDWMVSWSDVLIGPVAGTEWDLHSLGVALKAILAIGAIVLSALVLLWDLRVTLKPDRRAYYKSRLGYFWLMDLMAFAIWISVLGAVLPEGRVVFPRMMWIQILMAAALAYAFVAAIRLIHGIAELSQCKTDAEALTRTAI